MGASGVNWNNIPHEMILSQINGGAGAAPVIDAAYSYERIAALLREADTDLRAALAATGASWEGLAAEDMQNASTPLATWADEADQLAVKTSNATEVFGDQFAYTRGSMPAVVDVPSGSWVDDIGLSGLPGVTTDRERAEADADAAQQESARKMEAYDNASYDTVQTQFFSQPPTVTLEVPPPSTGGGPSVGGISTTTSGPSGAGAYVPPGGWTAPGGGVTPSPAVRGAGVGGGVGGTGVVPSSPTAPSGIGTSPTRTIPSTTPPGGGTYPGGGSTGGGGGVLPPSGGGGTLPGGRPRGGRSGSSSGVPGSELPVPPGMAGRGPGTGGYGGLDGPGTAGRGVGGPGAGGLGAGGGPSGRGMPGAGGSGGLGLTGFGDEAQRQRGATGLSGPGSAGGPGGPGGLAAAEAEAAARAGQAGRGGAPGAGGGYGPMAGGRGAQGEEDAEHKRPGYLVETEDVWGDGTRVAPPVIGERPS